MNVTVGRIETYYDDIGSGKVIVLLHGWGTDRSDLSYIAQELKTSYRLVSVDLPGFGETSINSRRSVQLVRKLR
jgi:pimeloyl-ACP methyl ester carboxylesterase